MPESSVESPLHFETFKVDNLQLFMKPNFDLLALVGMIAPQLWDINYELRIPTYFKSKNKYVGGFTVHMNLFPPGAQQQTKLPDNALIRFTASIVGVFRIDTGRVSEEVEKRLVKANIPMILMPHLRSVITSLFATAGYGSVIPPLVNIAVLAEHTFKDTEILVVE